MASEKKTHPSTLKGFSKLLRYSEQLPFSLHFQDVLGKKRWGNVVQIQLDKWQEKRNQMRVIPAYRSGGRQNFLDGIALGRRL